MRKIVCLLLLVPVFAFGQKLEENKIDEFTHHAVKRTSWETIVSPSFSGKSFVAYTQISKIDSVYYLDLKAMAHGVFAMDKGAKLMLKTKTDSIVTLYNLEFTVTCNGCGAKGFSGSEAQGIRVSFIIPSDISLYLKNNPIEKMRIYTTDGYMEENVKEKDAQVFIKQLQLVD